MVLLLLYNLLVNKQSTGAAGGKNASTFTRE